jgi:hypothetical protein
MNDAHQSLDFPLQRRAFAYADPQSGIGYGYVTNRIGTSLTDDPQDAALRQTMPSV